MIEDTIRQMKADGVKRAIAFVTSGFSCYSGCRQYREDIIHALEAAGEGAPQIDKIRVFYNHPGFITPVVDHLRTALSKFPDDAREQVHIIFTAHSIPARMAHNSAYEAQLGEACRLVAEQLGTARYELAYQSRSGSPHMPWLEPDILDYLEFLAEQGVTNVAVMPIGFLSDHMEVVFDLDTEAAEKAKELGMTLVCAETVGTAKPFVRMIRELIEERMTENPERLALGNWGANHDICPIACCLPG
jgi:ferrochelatase